MNTITQLPKDMTAQQAELYFALVNSIIPLHTYLIGEPDLNELTNMSFEALQELLKYLTDKINGIIL